MGPAPPLPLPGGGGMELSGCPSRGIFSILARSTNNNFFDPKIDPPKRLSPRNPPPPVGSLGWVGGWVRTLSALGSSTEFLRYLVLLLSIGSYFGESVHAQLEYFGLGRLRSIIPSLYILSLRWLPTARGMPSFTTCSLPPAQGLTSRIL